MAHEVCHLVSFDMCTSKAITTNNISIISYHSGFVPLCILPAPHITTNLLSVTIDKFVFSRNLCEWNHKVWSLLFGFFQHNYLDLS